MIFKSPGCCRPCAAPIGRMSPASHGRSTGTPASGPDVAGESGTVDRCACRLAGCRRRVTDGQPRSPGYRESHGPPDDPWQDGRVADQSRKPVQQRQQAERGVRATGGAPRAASTGNRKQVEDASRPVLGPARCRAWWFRGHAVLVALGLFAPLPIALLALARSSSSSPGSRTCPGRRCRPEARCCAESCSGSSSRRPSTETVDGTSRMIVGVRRLGSPSRAAGLRLCGRGLRV